MSYKAQVIAHELADELKLRFSGLAVVEGSDANGDSTIAIGAGSNGGRNAFIRVKGIDWPLAKDVLGLASPVYTPHVIQLATEANFAGTTDNVADVLTGTDVLSLIATIAKRGTKVEWYLASAGTAPVVGTLIAAKFAGSIEAELYYGMKASQ